MKSNMKMNATITTQAKSTTFLPKTATPKPTPIDR